MARARFIRPEFFTDAKMADLPFGACMLYAGIWCHSDLRGVFEHDPRTLRGLIFPMRDGIDTATVGTWLEQLEHLGCIARFEANGKTWGYVCKWSEHQSISTREKELGSRRPAPPRERPRHDTSTTPGHARVSSPSPSPSPASAAASSPRAEVQPQQPPDPGELFDQPSQGPTPKPEPEPVRRMLDRRTFADWRVQVGHRIYWTEAEDETWKALFQAEGWDEMTKAYQYLDGKHPKPKALFLSYFQGLR